jgi:hypothetical protein
MRRVIQPKAFDIIAYQKTEQQDLEPSFPIFLLHSRNVMASYILIYVYKRQASGLRFRILVKIISL